MSSPRWTLVAVLLTACSPVTNPDATDARTDGGPDASGLIDAGAIDAPPGSSDLGVPCDLGAPVPCASGHQCVVLGLTGSSTLGYCSPPCTEAGGECAIGYAGPPGGDVACAVGGPSGGAEFCAILCDANSECPNGLACTKVPGQGLFVCDAQP